MTTSVTSFVAIPAIDMWYRSIGENHQFSYYLPICAMAGVHGAICGFIAGRTRRGAILGGFVALIVAVMFCLLFFLIGYLSMVYDLWGSKYFGILTLLSQAFVFMFWSLFYSSPLAMPIFINGALINFFFNKVIERSVAKK